MKRLIATLLLLWSAFAGATPAGIYKAEVGAPMDTTYQAVYAALEAARFWVVFEANIGQSLSRSAARWGEDYNRNRLDGIRSMVVCNSWYANQVSNADPDLLALCPLRVNLVHKGGVTSVLFARPSAAAAGSPGMAVIKEVETLVIKAIEAGIAKAGKGVK